MGTKIPDFSIEIYKNTANQPILILFECKLHLSKLILNKNNNISLKKGPLVIMQLMGAFIMQKALLKVANIKKLLL